MMTSRERMIAALSHREADRVPVLEEIWSTTRDRWTAEGLPEGLPFDRSLGIDEFIAFGSDRSFRFPEETIEQTPDYDIVQDANGVRVKRLKMETFKQIK